MICTVVGARPNFVKMAPIILELQKRGIAQLFVHTGQHYDKNMSEIFFDQLGMPKPDVYLQVGSGSHADQTARIMQAFEAVCLRQTLDLVIVAGDVNSTFACAIVAAKCLIPVAHIESGLRSFDKKMPEEINRILTDHISDLLFTTEPSGNENLLKEGIDSEKIHYLGNSMIDSLARHISYALKLSPWEKYQVEPNQYGIVTLHRPSNVDNPETIRDLASAIREIGKKIPLIFPIHPRTLSQAKELWEGMDNIYFVEPLGYLEFLGLMAKSKFVITDSGGIQEETTALGIPCITVRDNTERPITLTTGTNRLVKPMVGPLVAAVETIISSLSETRIKNTIPDFWDGHASIRIVDCLEAWLQARPR